MTGTIKKVHGQYFPIVPVLFCCLTIFFEIFPDLELSRHAAHVTPFFELPEQALSGIGTTDEYDSDYSCFEVLGMKVKVDNEQLAEALKRLPEKKPSDCL